MATVRNQAGNINVSAGAGTDASSYINTGAITSSKLAYSHLQLTLHPNAYEVCDAVKLMTTRMESNIKEFYLTNAKSKFGDMTYAVRARIQDPEKNKDKLFILNDTEIQFYWDAYIKESKRALHEEVMARILKTDDEVDENE
jgi:hypothetical protein